MRDQFYKLCSDDPACAVNLPEWKREISTWAPPSDSGTCVTWLSQKVYDVDPLHVAPIKNTEGPNKGKNKTWPELAETGVFLPAKESYAKIKTWVQSQCHKRKECGEAGKWESTIKSVDSTIELQKEKGKNK